MHIKNLTTNCKSSDRNRAYEFDKLNIITGANASGKSGLVGAIELALTGRVDGLGERSQELLKLGDASGLFVNVELSNGDICKYEVSESGKHWTGKRGTIRSKLINELISLGPKKAKELLLSYADRSGLVMPDSLLWKKLWTGDITTMPSTIRSRKLALSKIISSVTELSPTSNEADELKKNIAKAQAANRIAELHREIETILPKVTRSYDMYATFQQVTDVQKANKSFAHCLACGASIKYWNKDRVEQIDYAEVDLWKKLSGLRKEIREIEDRFNGSVLLEVPADILKRMRDRLGEIERTKPYVHITDAELVSIRTEYAELQELERQAEAVVKTGLRLYVIAIQDRMHALTGEMFQMRLDPFEFGYLRNGKFLPFEVMSGAERAICASALACCTGSAEHPSIIIVDDVWLDSASSDKLLGVLSSAIETGFIDQAFVTMVNVANSNGWKVVSV